MNDTRKDEVMNLLDLIFKSCCQDANQKLRSTEERLMKFVSYIGWLEGNILDLLTDDQAEALKERIPFDVLLS